MNSKKAHRKCFLAKSEFVFSHTHTTIGGHCREDGLLDALCVVAFVRFCNYE